MVDSPYTRSWQFRAKMRNSPFPGSILSVPVQVDSFRTTAHYCMNTGNQVYLVPEAATFSWYCMLLPGLPG